MSQAVHSCLSCSCHRQMSLSTWCYGHFRWEIVASVCTVSQGRLLHSSTSDSECTVELASGGRCRIATSHWNVGCAGVEFTFILLHSGTSTRTACSLIDVLAYVESSFIVRCRQMFLVYCSVISSTALAFQFLMFTFLLLTLAVTWACKLAMTVLITVDHGYFIDAVSLRNCKSSWEYDTYFAFKKTLSLSIGKLIIVIDEWLTQLCESICRL